MKRLFISAGVVAIGAASLQLASADDAIGSAKPKIWNVSATLRGFYDSDYTAGSGGSRKSSWGAEVSPSFNANISLAQTDIGIKYTYGLYYYQARQDDHQNALDQTHHLDFWLDHAFDERWKVNLTDTLGVGQEPSLIGSGGVPFRVNGDNIGNHFNIALDTQWTRQFSTALHYGNDFYDYQNSGGTAASPSLAGLLNRVDENIGLDLQWNFTPETMAFVGYDFDWVDYVGDEDIGAAPPVTYRSDDRNYYKHQVHVGLQHQFAANLTGSVSVGAQYTDEYNDPVSEDKSWSPYANLSLTYTYLPGSYVQLGFTHDINSTFETQVNAATGSLSQYQESSILYVNVNHHLTKKLLLTGIGQVEFSDYKGGTYDSDTDTYYTLGVGLSYQFNRYFSTDIGYNYDNLQSDIAGLTYTRNYAYLGVTLSY